MSKFNVNFKSIIRFFWILLLCICMINVLNTDFNGVHADISVLLTFMLIAIISLINIIKDKTPYSLNKTFWYFNLIFFFIAPIIQYKTGYRVWNYGLDNDAYLNTNLFILLSDFIFMLFYKKIKKDDIISQEKIKIETTSVFKSILFVCSLICLFIVVKNIGFASLFSREENSYSISGDGMFNTIFTHLLKCIPVYAFFVFYSEKNKITLPSIIILIIICLLNFPTSTTRFWMGAIYIGIFLIIFNKKSKENRTYDILILLIFTIIFSLLYSFKFHDLSYFMENGIDIKNFKDSYNSVDYDAYSIIYRSFDYVKANDIVFGRQLIGTLLFIIPRSIWPAKPKPTGDLIVSSQGQWYTNVSCPFLAEGYINFGIIGTILFQIILAILCSKLDNNYWKNKKNNSYIKFLYPFLMGFLIFLERGALHPTVVYLFCFSIPLIFTVLLNIFRKVKKYDYKSC